MQLLRVTAGALTTHPALFANLFLRELRGRYIGSVTGVFWAILHPVMLLAVYSFLFTTIFKVRLPELASASFLSFVAVALWPWMATQEGLQRAVVAVVNQAALIRKVAFPHELVVVGSVSAVFAIHFVGYVVIMILLSALGEPIHLLGLISALPIWIALLLATCGLGFVLAASQVFVKDIEHVLGPLLMVIFYLVPILYPPSLVPAELRPLVDANPFSFVVERLRTLLLRDPLAIGMGEIYALAVGVLLFIGGRNVFRRLSPHFEDFV
jgi:ABC-type polysaccharide/polyol phosphate export permease